jgi:hypothetical protein
MRLASFILRKASFAVYCLSTKQAAGQLEPLVSAKETQLSASRRSADVSWPSIISKGGVTRYLVTCRRSDCKARVPALFVGEWGQPSLPSAQIDTINFVGTCSRACEGPSRRWASLRRAIAICSGNSAGLRIAKQTEGFDPRWRAMLRPQAPQLLFTRMRMTNYYPECYSFFCRFRESATKPISRACYCVHPKAGLG